MLRLSSLVESLHFFRVEFGGEDGELIESAVEIADGELGFVFSGESPVADLGIADFADIAAQNGLTSLPSATNFVALDCGRDGAFAKSVLDQLIARGLFVRMPFVAPQNRCIRISVGRDQDLDLLAELLPVALKAARG